MERPAFWKVPRDLHQHQVTESEGGGAPSRPQPAASDSHTEDKPALATLASYSIGFANIGLKGSPLTTRSAEPPPPCFEPQAEAHSLPQQPQHLGSMLQKPNKPAVTALASFALDLADSSQVHAGSPADGVVQRGDLVRKISDYDSRDIRHEDVTTLFKNAGQAIKLVIARESRVSAPPSAPGSRSSSVPPTLPIAPSIQGNDSPYIMASLNPALIDHPRPYCASPHRAELEEEYHMVTDQPYRTTPLVLPGAKVKKDALPTESYLRHHPNPLMRAPPPPHGIPQEVMMKQKVADSVLQRVVGDDPKKKVVSQFNSPIGLYSEENIVNTIAQQTGATPIFPPPSEAPSRLSFKKTVVYDPAKSETYKALKESEYGDTIQEIPTPVQPKVFSPAKVNSKATPHRSTAAHSVPGPMHNINSIGANDNIQQSNTFKRLMHMVLEEESY